VYRIFDAVRIGQITGATGQTWKHLTDPVGHPLLTDTGRFWNAIGIDLGANAEHSDGRLYLFTGDVATDQSGKPPDNSDMVAWTAEPELLRNGGHLLTDSWDFQLPRSGPNVRGQPGWQFCMRCCALFYTLGTPAACSLGGTHDTYGLSWDLSVPVEPATEGQNQWRFCTKCHQLFYKAAPATAARAAATTTTTAAGRSSCPCGRDPKAGSRIGATAPTATPCSSTDGRPRASATPRQEAASSSTR